MRRPCLKKHCGRNDSGKTRGRPAARWFDDIKEWTGLTATNASRLANGRKKDVRLSSIPQRANLYKIVCLLLSKFIKYIDLYPHEEAEMFVAEC